MARFFNSILSAFKYGILVLIGTGFALFILSYLIFLAAPLFLYRWLVIKIWAPLFGDRDLGKAVNALGSALALEFRKFGDLCHPRFSIVINGVMESHVTYQEFYDRMDQQWIRSRNETGELKYPELQQHLVRRLGFMFFKNDPDFRLDNHIKLHTLPESYNDQDCDKFLNNLVEEQINERWTAERSPWEAHLVQNFKNSSLPSREEKMTLVVMRFHHGIIDGFSFMSLFLEELLGNKLDLSSLPQPASGRRRQSALQKLWHNVTLPFKTLHGFGLIVAMMGKKKTPFHCPDSIKAWWQIFQKGTPIPVKKVKLIKNTFGVSFAAVMDSAVGYALGRMMKLKLGEKETPKSITYAVTVPLPNHPKKLRNHAGGLVYEVPLTPKLETLDRLRKVEENLSQVRLYPLVMIFHLLGKAIGGIPIPIEMVLAKNRYVATGLSSLPGTLGVMAWKDRRFLSCDFVAGAGMGMGGIGFFSLSYMDNIVMAAVAEKAILSREELEQIFIWIGEYVETLHELALERQMESRDKDDSVMKEKNVNVAGLEIC